MSGRLLAILLLLMCWSVPVGAAPPMPHSTGPGVGPLDPGQVPDPLKPWIGWSLHGIRGMECPFRHDDHRRALCQWPGRLSLRLDHGGGSFAQEWRIWEEGWVTLPGDERHWPQDVVVEGEHATVVAREGKPTLHLTPGTHRVEGRWLWERLPERVAVPPEVGLVQLTVGGEEVARPNLDAKGRLWLRAREQPPAEEDRLSLTVQRKISDAIPLQITTRMEMDVAGRQREVVLPQPLNAGLVPLSLSAPLPVTLEPDGRIRVQARPGHWVVELVQRHRGPVRELHLEPPAESGWVEEEVWVFEAQNHLRMVTVEGVTAIDPQQTTLPRHWRGLPAYLIQPGQSMVLNERRRGGADETPDRLRLNRSWWLDFDGGGYTVRDELQGVLNRPGRLEMTPAIQLGRVAVGGRDQLITRAAGSQGAGVEMRRGEMKLVAEGRVPRGEGVLPAVGWRQEVQELSGHLHLPPGWRLWHAAGVDAVHSSWLNRWTLLDLFLVLVIALGVGRMWGWRWVGLAGPALILIHHEESALTWFLLHLLVATALVRVVPPEGWFRRWVQAYRGLMVAALVVAGLPFLVDQARLALYPQLEQGGGEILAQPYPRTTGMDNLINVLEGPLEADLEEAAPANLAPQQEAKAPPPVQEQRLQRKGAAPKGKGRSYYDSGSPRQVSREVDPNARVQTGPGLPQWSWRAIDLRWNGPVGMDQELELWLTPPWLNRGLAVARILLLLGVMALFLGWSARPPGRGRGMAAAVVVLLGVGGALLVPEARAGGTQPLPEVGLPSGDGGYPAPALLEQLAQRLTAPPTCLPGCADLPRMELEVAGRELRLQLEVHAAREVAIPLPGGVQHWLPRRVLVEGQPATALMRDDQGHLLLAIPPGRHRVVLEGSLPPREKVQLPLPLPPRRVSARAQGWEVAGIGEEGVPEETLALQRAVEESKAQGDAPASPPGGEGSWQPLLLPPLLEVERSLMLVLGQEWRVRTTVRRLSPATGAVILELPLLAGESVTTGGVRVIQGRMQLNMAAGVTESSWESVLPLAEVLVLRAGEDSAWHEVWRLEASPVWHVESHGIPAVPPSAGQERWSRQWRPWPGEELRLVISRPEAIPGQTLTLERSELTFTPGLRATEATLKLHLKSSRGDQHRVTLPEGAELLGVVIDGTTQPIGQEGRQVAFPIVPGSQEVTLTWRLPEGMSGSYTTPPVDLGVAGVNAHLRLKLPRERWLWWSAGPLVGPAVLFWGSLGVVLAVAVGLGRLPLTPLTTLQWLLLGTGFITVSAESALVVAGWFLVLGWRGRNLPPTPSWWRFNLIQLGLILWTLAAASALVGAIQQGLLGYPDMQVTGNGSSQFHLHWYQDRHGPVPQSGWAATVPLMFYRLLMLGWSLWLASAVIRWARWGWDALAHGELWRSRPPRPPRNGGWGVGWRRGGGGSPPEGAAGGEPASPAVPPAPPAVPPAPPAVPPAPPAGGD